MRRIGLIGIVVGTLMSNGISRSDEPRTLPPLTPPGKDVKPPVVTEEKKPATVIPPVTVGEIVQPPIVAAPMPGMNVGDNNGNNDSRRRCGPAAYQPGFFGDFYPAAGSQIAIVPGPPDPTVVALVRVPLSAALGSIKVADNESPRPTDRFYFNYGYFNDVYGSFNRPFTDKIDLQRQTIGFEKTLFNGNASFGMRFPWVETYGSGISERQYGDMSFVFKVAIINDACTNNVLSVGMNLSIPTGAPTRVATPVLVVDRANQPVAIFRIDNNRVLVQNNPGPVIGFRVEDINPTYFQPWIGGVLSLNQDFYIQSFVSLAAPTDDRAVTAVFSDVGLGYWLYRNSQDRLVQGIVSATEFHVTTPINHRKLPTIPVSMPDVVDLTTGFHILLPRSVAGFAVGVPITGPRPFDISAMGSITFRF
jgi:hypothetical protein